MRRSHYDIDKLPYWAILLLANGVLLIIGGFAMALLREANHHPSEAGDPFRMLPFWQRGLWSALFLGLIEVGMLGICRHP